MKHDSTCSKKLFDTGDCDHGFPDQSDTLARAQEAAQDQEPVEPLSDYLCSRCKKGMHLNTRYCYDCEKALFPAEYE